MTLGEQFKKLRSEKGFSQPELAEIAGIEQSYLSKLENDKSLPSNEVFRKILCAFDISIAQLLAPLEQSYINKNLLLIADIEHYCQQNSTRQLSKQRHILYTSSLFIVVAVTLFYTGFSKQLFNESRYEYFSKGVVLAGEPMNVFTHWSQLIDRKDAPARNQKKIIMAQRSDEMIILTREHKGTSFEMQVTGGKRLFRYARDERVPNPINAWLQIIAVFMFSCGIMGFILERQFFKAQ